MPSTSATARRTPLPKLRAADGRRSGAGDDSAARPEGADTLMGGQPSRGLLLAIVVTGYLLVLVDVSSF
jgi:hypothetical protein